ncbi:MAG: DUF817 family protein [Fulvimonas sp.]|nr:DUF817 family protein [Fulvimonas sp.]
MSWSLLLLVLAAFAAGVQNALAGGGSFLTFPALLVAGIDPRTANIASTIALFPGQVTTGLAGRRHVAGAKLSFRFFSRHYLPDMRWLMFGALALLFGPYAVYFRVRIAYRSVPLLLGFALVAWFIWMAENLGIYAHAWLYPTPRAGWHPVAMGKLGAWLLLMTISYAVVAALHARQVTVCSGTARSSRASCRRLISGNRGAS